MNDHERGLAQVSPTHELNEIGCPTLRDFEAWAPRRPGPASGIPGELGDWQYEIARYKRECDGFFTGCGPLIYVSGGWQFVATNNGDSTVLDNRANAFLRAFRQVPGIKGTTKGLNCISLAATSNSPLVNSTAGAPSYPISGIPVITKGLGWFGSKQFPEIAEALDSSILRDLVPALAVANSAAIAYQCYYHAE